MHIASLIFGIIALITCWMPVFGLTVSVISLIITIIAFCIKNKSGSGMKIAGLVLTIIALIISGLMTYSIYWVSEQNEEVKEQMVNVSFKSDMSNYKAAYTLYLTSMYAEILNFDKSLLNIDSTEIEEILGEISDKHEGKLSIVAGELTYETSNLEEQKILTELGIKYKNK